MRWQSGTKHSPANDNRAVNSVGSGYTIFKVGSRIHGESNFEGGTDYEDSNADDMFVYVHDALPSGGTAVVKRGSYTKTQTLNLTKGYQRWVFEPGSVITHSGSAEAIKIGSDTTEVKRTELFGNYARIERASSGGTYGFHLENAHLCHVGGFYMKNFATAPVLMEGSWGSKISHIEVEQSYRGTYGIHLRKTQAGTYAGHQNNDVGIHGCWLTGSTSAIYIQDDDVSHGSPCMVTINGLNDIHDSPKGIHVDAGHLVVVEHNFFENVDGYHLHLEGADAEIGNVHFIRNWLHIPAGKTAIYCKNVTNVTVAGNSVEGGAGAKFIDTEVDATNRWIFIYPNRLAATVTEYAGNTQSLKYHHAAYPGSSDVLTVNSAIGFSQSSVFNNNLYLQWKDAGGTARDILGLAADDIVRLKNPDPTTAGHIYIMPTDGGVTDGTRGQTYVGFGSRGNISIGCPTGLVPANIYLKCNAAGDVEVTQANQFLASCNVNTTGVYKKGGVQVVGAQGASITDTGGGAGGDNDGTARVAIDLILARLRAHGLIAT